MYVLSVIKGYLCGQCRGDKGVSALLNNCMSCGYVNILLIVALGNSIQYSQLKILYTHTHIKRLKIAICKGKKGIEILIINNH